MLVSTMPEPCQSSVRLGPTNACGCQLNANCLYLIVIMANMVDGYPEVGGAAESVINIDSDSASPAIPPPGETIHTSPVVALDCSDGMRRKRGGMRSIRSCAEMAGHLLMSLAESRRAVPRLTSGRPWSSSEAATRNCRWTAYTAVGRHARRSSKPWSRS